MNFLREVFRKLSSDIQTDRQTYRIDRNYKACMHAARGFAGGQKFDLFTTDWTQLHKCSSS